MKQYMIYDLLVMCLSFSIYQLAGLAVFASIAIHLMWPTWTVMRCLPPQMTLHHHYHDVEKNTVGLVVCVTWLKKLGGVTKMIVSLSLGIRISPTETLTGRVQREQRKGESLKVWCLQKNFFSSKRHCKSTEQNICELFRSKLVITFNRELNLLN